MIKRKIEVRSPGICSLRKQYLNIARLCTAKSYNEFSERIDDKSLPPFYSMHCTFYFSWASNIDANQTWPTMCRDEMTTQFVRLSDVSFRKPKCNAKCRVKNFSPQNRSRLNKLDLGCFEVCQAFHAWNLIPVVNTMMSMMHIFHDLMDQSR